MTTLQQLERKAAPFVLALIIIAVGSTPEGKMMIRQTVELVLFFGALRGIMEYLLFA